MLVETYETPEIDCEGTPECESEAIALIESLGLEGQAALLKPKQGGGQQRVPYRKLTKYEAFVWEQVCQKKTNLKQYKDAAIPLRVLQVAAHAKDLFDRVYVWHPESADLKDPVLIGVNGHEYGDQERFLLARWGETLVPFGELAAKAAVLFRAKYKAECAKIAAQAQAAVTAVDGIDGEELAAMAMPKAYGLN